MKILLTGKPRTGKTTILDKFREQYKGQVAGILSREIHDEHNERIGFVAENMRGQKKLFAHKTQIDSPYIVGGKYFVDKAVLDNFFVEAITKKSSGKDTVFLIDELGRMQSFSQIFLQKVLELIESDVEILGTIVFDGEEWSRPFKQHPEVILVTVTEENREMLPEILIALFSNAHLYRQLSFPQKETGIQWSRTYFAGNKLTQIKKLFKNALPYIIAGEIKKQEEGLYLVWGKTRNHIVKVHNGYSCDCDLFNGKNEYTVNAGECSHIQSVKLFTS